MDTKQETVATISNFILVDRAGQEEGEADQLEGELSRLGERWLALCRDCQDRQQELETLDTKWTQLQAAWTRYFSSD